MLNNYSTLSSLRKLRASSERSEGSLLANFRGPLSHWDETVELFNGLKLLTKSVIITGFEKTSLQDFPDRISSILFTQGCDWRCRFCHNPELVEKAFFLKPISEEEIYTELKMRQNFIEAVTVTGGEPTIYSDLPVLLTRIKKLGLLVKLDSNGLRPKVLNKLIKDGLVDYLAIDLKAPLERYPEITQVALDHQRIKASIRVIMESRLPYEFRTTLVPDFHGSKDVLQMAKQISGAQNYYLQNFTSSGKILDPTWKFKRSFTQKEMLEFKNIAEPFVKNCQIR